MVDVSTCNDLPVMDPLVAILQYDGMEHRATTLNSVSVAETNRFDCDPDNAIIALSRLLPPLRTPRAVSNPYANPFIAVSSLSVCEHQSLKELARVSLDRKVATPSQPSPGLARHLQMRSQQSQLLSAGPRFSNARKVHQMKELRQCFAQFNIGLLDRLKTFVLRLLKRESLALAPLTQFRHTLVSE